MSEVINVHENEKLELQYITQMDKQQVSYLKQRTETFSPFSV
jgi:hypothetical protein